MQFPHPCLDKQNPPELAMGCWNYTDTTYRTIFYNADSAYEFYYKMVTKLNESLADVVDGKTGKRYTEYIFFGHCVNSVKIDSVKISKH